MKDYMDSAKKKGFLYPIIGGFLFCALWSALSDKSLEFTIGTTLMASALYIGITSITGAFKKKQKEKAE